MANRQGGRQTVTLYAAGGWTQQRSFGFGHRDVVADELKRGAAYALNMHPANALYGLKGVGEDPVPVVCCIGGRDAEGVIARPFLWAAQAALQDEDWWTASTNSSWLNWAHHVYGERIFYQQDGTESQQTSAESKFDLPPNPCFCVSLWRGECNADHDHSTNPLYTAIRFGNRDGQKQYSLVIPYGGKGPRLYEYNLKTEDWEQLEAESNRELPAFEGLPHGQMKFIWIGVFDYYIHISYDAWGNETVAYRIYGSDSNDEGEEEEAWWRPHVFSGPVKLLHNSGQWAFTCWPIYMYHQTGADLLRVGAGPYDFGYVVADNTNTVTTDVYKWPVYADPESADEPKEILADITTTVTTKYSGGSTWSRARGWKATWTPYLWQSAITGVGTFQSYVSPILYSVQVRQSPLVARITGPSSSAVTDIRAIHIDWPEGNRCAIGGIELKNLTGTYRTLGQYQAIKIACGYDFDDASNNEATVFFGHVVNPGHKVRVAGLQAADLVLYDPLIRMRDQKAYGFEPDFQFFDAEDAMQWALERCGFASDQYSISGGTKELDIADGFRPGADDWVPHAGVEWMEFVESVCAYDNESDWYLLPDDTYQYIVYKHDGAFTATSVDYELKEASTGTDYQIFEIRRDWRGMDTTEYANAVLVRGRDKDGNRVGAFAWYPGLHDPANAHWAGGWPHIHVLETTAVDSQADAEEWAQDKLTELGRRPEFIEVETNVIPGAYKGQVFSVTGPAAGKAYNMNARNCKYRIVSIRLIIRYDSRNSPRMVLTGRYIGTV